MFGDFYRGKRVLVTGHTGFKGSWLCLWLRQLGADVYGLSLNPPTQPALFDLLQLDQHIHHRLGDIRDYSTVSRLMQEVQPDVVFHLAAQPIVSLSYRAPLDTISSNVLGTSCVLEALRQLTSPCQAVLITSDKCYDNAEWVWGYREHDRLGGKDIYSGSKAAAEIIINSYRHSFFPEGHPVRLASARAGNVIGGGDWAIDRIVADCIRAWSKNEAVQIRSPRATRPWQHVLEPLSGYLTLGHALALEAKLHGESFNFGPRPEQNHTVHQLIRALAQHWGITHEDEACQVTDDIPFHEAGLLRLSCEKAETQLRWQATLDYQECTTLTGLWYQAWHEAHPDLFAYTSEQICQYQQLAQSRQRQWAQHT